MAEKITNNMASQYSKTIVLLSLFIYKINIKKLHFTSSEANPTFGHANANFSVFLTVQGMNF